MKLRNKILLILLFLFLVTGASSYFYIRSQLFVPRSAKETEKIFEIKEGQGVVEIIENLEKEGFIRNKWVTLGYLKYKGTEKNLKAGTFLLKSNLKPVEILDVITSGENALKKLTIIEGWTKKDIAENLDERGIVQKKDFLETAKRENWNYSFLENSSSLEGFLFPDTYSISYKADAEEIIKKMLDNFDKKLTADLQSEIKKQNKSIKEIIITASIIEKEVTKEEDRKIVAGIFYKRIREGKPLEADSTINYITGKSKAQPSYEDTRAISEFNTYLNKGLPPNPICNPGLSSIKAAIYPEDSPYYYYLNRQDTKETIFSKTYEEHLENKSRYLK